MKKQNLRSIKAQLRRHLRYAQLGKNYFDKASQALARARASGLQIDQPVDLDLVDETGATKTERFHLVDNALDMQIKGAVYRPARFPQFELKKLPKNPRNSGVSPDSKVGVPPAEEVA